MPAGLQVINDYNVIQIDQDFKNMAYRGKGVSGIARVNTAAGFIGYYADIAVAADEFVAVYSPSQYIGLESVSVSGGSKVFRYRFGESTPAGYTFTYYVFGPPGSPPENYGLEVYNEAGELTYASSFRYMRPFHFHFFEESGGSPIQIGSFAFPSGVPEQYGMVISRPTGYWHDYTDPDEGGSGSFNATSETVLQGIVSSSSGFSTQRVDTYARVYTSSVDKNSYSETTGFYVLFLDLTGY